MTWQNGVRFASTGTGVGTTSSNWSWIYNVQPFGAGAGAEFGAAAPLRTLRGPAVQGFR